MHDMYHSYAINYVSAFLVLLVHFFFVLVFQEKSLTWGFFQYGNVFVFYLGLFGCIRDYFISFDPKKNKDE